MLIDIRNSTPLEHTYRVARALGLFNVAPEAVEYTLSAQVPIADDGSPEGEWRIGAVCGPSGSGKTSIARALATHGWTEWGIEAWPDSAVIDAIDPDGSFENVTNILASVGLGTVPAWLRPYRVLSNGEKYRAELARLLAESPDQVFYDEFTSVLDRKVAVVGAQAFAKAWRRLPEPRRVVFLTPHVDVLPWLAPDWTLYTSLEGVSSEDQSTMGPRREDYDSQPVAEVVA